MLEITSPRLRLIALSFSQLDHIYHAPELLEAELDISISRLILQGPVQRALSMKLSRMQKENEKLHPWSTYWLMITLSPPFGAGMVGFKGAPDKNGSTDIGYGIDPTCQNQGFMTEAVKAMLTWAFSHPACRVITAKGVLKTNFASQHVLQKSGFRCNAETSDTLDWVINRPSDE